ncbi:MAG: hypothetical protein ABJF10_18100 [Chthoniobacter sp.]|uniref:hypothetical protein n=1 Tax=Chthoniobacter sp. TaxID=2510640 RepID=UPI0032ACC0FA
MKELPIRQARIPHRHAWLWEPLEEIPTFFLRSMFGCKAVYLDGKIVVVFCTKAEPWCGMLVCTDREHHPSLTAEFSELVSHPILGKWLYLSESHDRFDRLAERIVRLALKHDPRVGVVPALKKKRGSRKSGKR